ncbi:MAG: ATP-binding protein [Candidatus Brockarchaeota archaeon]|nr:ATP-binding protein [Candidatus Brockarchaeota archaeon]
MQAVENAFLIGEELDSSGALKGPLRLSVDDVSVHGVIIGMTGSGKTGLSIVMMEEALINRIPVIAIDVKGDLSNLGLGVIEDSSSDHRKKKPLENASEHHSDLDKRLQAFKESAEISVYSPGSMKGMPVSLVNCLRAPAREIGEEGLRETASNVASSLLSLIGLEPGPFKTKEHLLLSEIFEYAWKNNIELSFGEMMRMVFSPPFERVGGVDVESFIPLKQRRKLAFSMNSVIGSPNFRRWTYGVPMDIDYFLKSAADKTVASVFYLSHLESGERMMFVSLLLQAVYSWMLKKGAADRPRLLLLFDEVYGFLPPFPRNPPSKQPLLSIIKQGRSFGTTVFLSTQNPVDIDYKALGNVCLWIIGRLQTENDRRRILEGIAEADVLKGSVKKQDLEGLISTLRQREFVVYNARGQSLHRCIPGNASQTSSDP